MFYEFTNKAIACQNCKHWEQHYTFLEHWGYIKTNSGHCDLEIDKRLIKKHRKPSESCRKFEQRNKNSLEEAREKLKYF